MQVVLDSSQYVFTKGGTGVGTIVFALPFNIEQEQILHIYNVTDTRKPIIYEGDDPAKMNYGGAFDYATQKLTIQTGTSGMNNGDALQILVELTSSQVSIINANTVEFQPIAQALITVAGVEIAPANPNRKGVIISNQSGGAGGRNCWIAFGDNPVAQENLRLGTGESLIIDNTLLTKQEINGITNTGTTLISIQEAE